MVYLWFTVCVIYSTVLSIKYLDYCLVAATLITRQPIWSADSNSDSPSSNTISRCNYPAADARWNSWLTVARLPTKRRLADSQSPRRARCGQCFAGICQTRPALEIQPFTGPTTPHWLPHNLPACLSVYSLNSNKYLWLSLCATEFDIPQSEMVG
jgi:hypothetical protein